MANGTIAASQLEMLTQSGTGIVTIVPPATNTNRTLTLPDATGTLVTTDSIPANTYIGVQGQVFTSSGTFTVPTGITTAKVTVIGGGGNGGSVTGSASAAGGGGGGGVAIKYVTGLTPGDSVTVTVGGIAGTSSFGAFCSATGGTSAVTVTGNTTTGAGGAGGAGSGGDINISGSAGANGSSLPDGCSTSRTAGSGGGSSGNLTITNALNGWMTPGYGFLSGAGGVMISTDGNGPPANGNGNGGSGAKASSTIDRTGGAGSVGIVIVEW